MREPRWIGVAAARTMHAELIAEYGGRAGVRDENVLEAALARPRQVFSYEESSIHRLAAAYGVAFALNHPFVDGNKRVALASMSVFLDLNGYELTASEAAAVRIIWDLAAARVTEEELTAWVAANTRPT